MIDEFEKRWESLKPILRKTVPYFIDLAGGIAMGLLICLLFGIPFTFFRDINMDIVHFIIGLPAMCVTLYRRCFRRSYHANSRTYSFNWKTSAKHIAICIAGQSLLVIILGAHSLYVTGPTYWITDVLIPGAYRSDMGGHFLREGYDWLFMFLADIFLYAPVMIYGEYIGSKERKIDYQIETQE